MAENQYLEIYKLHFNNMNEMSNRRVNVNRYYILALSVIILALSTLIRSGDFLSVIFTGSNGNSNLSGDLVALSMCIIGLLGAMLSESWIRNILGYLITSSHRYEVIKQLECNLDYNFIKKAYNRIDPKVEDTKSYFSLANHELHAPLIFQFGFTLLTVFGLLELGRHISGYQMIPIAMVISILFADSIFMIFNFMSFDRQS